MPVAKLTKRMVDQLTAVGKPVIYYDTEIKGFGIRVAPSGAKSWLIEYRPGSRGRQVAKRRMVLGSSGTLTPDQARNEARAKLAAVTMGQDPAGERSRLRENPTFADFAERYLSEEAAAKLKPRTVTNYRIYLRKHAAPVLGSVKLEAITRADVARMHRAIGRDKPMTANRVVECVGSVFRYAVVCGIVERGHNPAADIQGFREQRRERFLTREELGRLGDALSTAETVGIEWKLDPRVVLSKHVPRHRRTIIGPFPTAAIRLLLLTGARLREILNLKWSWVDLERGLLLLPDSKTGKKAIVLNAPAIAVLSALPRVGEYVIAGNRADRPRADLKRAWTSISNCAALEGVRLHDLRHTHASYGAGAGLGLPIIGKLLGHTQASTTERYAHLDTDPLRRASGEIGQLIVSALKGTRQQKGT